MRIQNQRQYRMVVIDPPAIAGGTDRIQVHFCVSQERGRFVGMTKTPQHSSPQKAQKAQNDFANTFVPFVPFCG
jgi:hypothetical protein